MSAVDVRDLTRRFRAGDRWLRSSTVTALDAVSFSVAAGAICAILGPNGAGKTTLLEILATLLLPHGGSARVQSHDVAGHPSAVRRAVAYAPSLGAGFFPRLTGRQNLEYFAALYGVPRQDWRRRTEAAAACFDIADALDRRFDRWSDGMRQRLALARARLADASVWLLDEPTRGLDPHARSRTQDTLRAIAREAGVTMLLSTHDLDEAARVCDQVVVLHRGRVTLDAPTSGPAVAGGALAEAYRRATREDEPCA